MPSRDTLRTPKFYRIWPPKDGNEPHPPRVLLNEIVEAFDNLVLAARSCAENLAFAEIAAIKFGGVEHSFDGLPPNLKSDLQNYFTLYVAAYWDLKCRFRYWIRGRIQGWPRRVVTLYYALDQRFRELEDEAWLRKVDAFLFDDAFSRIPGMRSSLDGLSPIAYWPTRLQSREVGSPGRWREITEPEIRFPDQAVIESIEKTVQLLRAELVRSSAANGLEPSAAGGIERLGLPPPSGNATAATNGCDIEAPAELPDRVTFDQAAAVTRPETPAGPAASQAKAENISPEVASEPGLTVVGRATAAAYELHKAGIRVTIAAVARRAAVDRSHLYKYPEVIKLIKTLATPDRSKHSGWKDQDGNLEAKDEVYLDDED